MGSHHHLCRSVAVLTVATLFATACGASDDASGSEANRPTIVVTTNILGDVVRQSVGDLANVDVIMPLGSDPHDFSPSARQAEAMEEADLLVVNGAAFEEGMSDIILNVQDSGTPIFTAADHVALLTLTDEDHEDHDDEDHEDHDDEDHDDDDPDDHEDGDHDDEDGDHEDHEDGDHDDEDHDDEDHDDEDHEEHDGDHDDEHDDDGHDAHDHGDGTDPHLWTDPDRVADIVEALGSTLDEMELVDSERLSSSVDAYIEELTGLAENMDTVLGELSSEQRVLVTNHEVFGYFADRFDFEVIGTVIPSLSTGAEPSAAALERLAELIEAESVPAVFAETTSSTRLADVLADEVGGDLAGQVVVVELFSESLGDEGSGAETYIDLMNTNANLVAEALGGS